MSISPVRRLLPQDSPAMANLHAQCFDYGWSIQDIEPHIQTDICLGLGDPLAGFVILRSIDDQAEILTLATDPAQRRQGIATALLLSGEKHVALLGAKVMFLDVAEDNSGATSFYKMHQYQPLSRRPAYYRRPEGRVAALVLRKDL